MQFAKYLSGTNAIAIGAVPIDVDVTAKLVKNLGAPGAATKHGFLTCDYFSLRLYLRGYEPCREITRADVLAQRGAYGFSDINRKFRHEDVLEC